MSMAFMKLPVKKALPQDGNVKEEKKISLEEMLQTLHDYKRFTLAPIREGAVFRDGKKVSQKTKSKLKEKASISNGSTTPKDKHNVTSPPVENFPLSPLAMSLASGSIPATLPRPSPSESTTRRRSSRRSKSRHLNEIFTIVPPTSSAEDALFSSPTNTTGTHFHSAPVSPLLGARTPTSSPQISRTQLPTQKAASPDVPRSSNSGPDRDKLTLFEFFSRLTIDEESEEDSCEVRHSTTPSNTLPTPSNSLPRWSRQHAAKCSDQRPRSLSERMNSSLYRSKSPPPPKIDVPVTVPKSKKLQRAMTPGRRRNKLEQRRSVRLLQQSRLRPELSHSNSQPLIHENRETFDFSIHVPREQFSASDGGIRSPIAAFSSTGSGIQSSPTSPTSLPTRRRSGARHFRQHSAFASPRTKRRHYRNHSTMGTEPRKIEWKRGELIGKGSFGKVYMGLNERTGQLVAVKQIPLTSKDEAKRATLLENEIRLLTKLQHPHIVQLFGSDQKNGYFNIIMEYVPGRSMHSMLRTFGIFAEDLMTNYTYQLLDALAYMHEHGIVHRDLKSKNILINQNGQIKLCDFGSAKQLPDILNKATPSINFSYTPLWIAPEVLIGSYDRKVDIWAVGCVIIEMATSKLPWAECQFANPFTALYHIQQDGNIPLIPDMFSELGKEFLLQCFIRDPEKRPDATELLHHRWLEESVGGMFEEDEY